MELKERGRGKGNAEEKKVEQSKRVENHVRGRNSKRFKKTIFKMKKRFPSNDEVQKQN